MKLGKGAKSSLLVTFIGILVISAFYSIPKSVLADNTYDFTGITSPSMSHVAYQGTHNGQPPPTLLIGSEFDTTRYQNIASSDDIRAQWGDIYSDFHRFRFKILESVDSITQIYVEHEGYGVDDDPNPTADLPGLTFYIWNYASSAWEALDSHNQGRPGDATLQKTITTNIGDYIDSSGYLNLLAQTKENSGSCPFLYTYNGEEYVFAADLYGTGIIDLPYYYPIPEDYAVVDGDLLAIDGGLYEVRIAQEYDEISYLDNTALITVDHSPNVQIATSFLRAEADKIYTVSRDLDAPLSATNGEGKDVLRQLIKKDGIFTSTKQHELNTLELDLGDMSGAREIKLVVDAYTKWTPGSNTEPYRRFVQVIDENGDWVDIFDISKIISPSAFPRSYVLDLTGRFMTDDYSVRFLSSSEIRIDFVGIDTSPQQEVIVNKLRPESADLHFRGYSSLEGVPATPDYYDLSPDAPMGFSKPIGNFTRFGDVLPLLEERDDEFVIMHHGDEISVEYPSVPVPEGMKRDFIFYSWGYYKNKYYGTGGTVDPLPFYGMSAYPYPANESYPHDSEHVRYLEEYNTREYSQVVISSEPSEHHTIYTDYVKVVISAQQQRRPINYVGGEVFSADKLAVLSPYLALFSVVAVVAVLVRRRAT